MITYKSTRGGDETKKSTEAIIQGIAGNRGLFVPDAIPPLPFKPEQKIGITYQHLAFHIMRSFMPEFTEEEFERCILGAYDSKFEAPDIAPVVKTDKAYFLELYHGRTAAFKDMALAILPYLLTTAMKKEMEPMRVVILTATSGDTGKAALEGFSDVLGTEIIIFYPKDGVSPVQERQMVTQTGKNAHVFAIEGNFDDAQAGVKRLFNDGAFAAELAAKGYRLSSANSINIGRLVPQVVYYVYAYIKLLEDGALGAGEPMNVVVPTGNFGNILAAYYAKSMGVPINKFICASNSNNVLTDFINTGIYDANRDFYATNSPSMDILISSNLERLLYHLSDGDCGEVSALMAELEKSGRYEVSARIKRGLADFYGGFCDPEATVDAIGRLYASEGYLMDTHTAVGYKVYENYLRDTGDKTTTVIVSTASAYKFADSAYAAVLAHGATAGGGCDGPPAAVAVVSDDYFAFIPALHEITGVRIPDALKNLANKEIRHTGVVAIDGMADAVRDSLA